MLKEIPGFPNYAITDDGRVWSKQRIRVKGSWLRHSYDRYGHVRVVLYRSGSRRRYFIHRLVLETFVGPCPEGMEGCHRDGDPSNNRIENLYWGTHADNVQDSVRHGTCSLLGDKIRRPTGEGHPSHKLTEAQVSDIRVNYAHGEVSQPQLAAQFSVAQSTIWSIVRGKTWQRPPRVVT